MYIIRHFRAQPLLCAMCALILVLTMSIPAVHADKSEKRRQKIDKREQETMQRLFKEKPKSRQLYNQSYGYAVFYGTQTALLISGGSGKGVAINKKTGERVYMGMPRGGRPPIRADAAASRARRCGHGCVRARSSPAPGINNRSGKSPVDRA